MSVPSPTRFGIKKRIAQGLIVLITVWPTVHFGLTKSLGLDPWKLGGFAMYTAPRLSSDLRVYALEGGIPLPLPPARVSRESVHKGWRFLVHRRTLTPNAPPDRVAESFFRDFPEQQVIQLEIITPRLDLSDGMLKTESTVYTYDRDAMNRGD